MNLFYRLHIDLFFVHKVNNNKNNNERCLSRVGLFFFAKLRLCFADNDFININSNDERYLSLFFFAKLSPGLQIMAFSWNFSHLKSYNSIIFLCLVCMRIFCNLRKGGGALMRTFVR